MNQGSLLAHFAEGGKLSQFCGQWILVEANTKTEEKLKKDGVLSLYDVVGGSKVKPFVLASWFTGQRGSQNKALLSVHGLVVPGSDVRVFKANKLERKGDGSKYIAFGSARPALDVYTQYYFVEGDDGQNLMLKPTRQKGRQGLSNTFSSALQGVALFPRSYLPLHCRLDYQACCSCPPPSRRHDQERNFGFPDCSTCRTQRS